MKQLESIEQYNELAQNENVIMMFSADWCGDCRYIEPELPEIEAAFPEYTFVHVDRDKFIDICVEHEIMGIPSFLAYKDGKEVGRFVSKDRKTKEEITNFIETLSA
ncbi:thiol reductase thioredoxin [Oceanobacillus arenosus]|uniref:Thiol reductase thioredoxin n=1 Tax=Oceanobacillus arenosus TaxID=1229153 RepID=A0A3D8PMC3_9BACI|nr:thioredoxin family protein [Oceanobacillus arenosus]RDW16389.1 thiol reductase thioredoxin [Oceanobacillus arenosus]